MLWQLLVKGYMTNNDSRTYSPSTTLSYTGMMHYLFRRYGVSNSAGYGDSLVLINTGMDAYGAHRPDLATTVHLFRWNAGTLAWDYARTWDIDKESMALDMGTKDVEEGEWRTISSDAKLIVEQQVNNFNTLGCCCGNCGDNYGALMPDRESGNVISGVGTGTFLGTLQRGGNAQKMIVGNAGAVDAEYRIWRYIPNNTVSVAPLPSQLNDTSGVWVSIAQHVVPAGQADAGNPRRYSAFFSVDAASTALYRIELLSGGPIQILGGEDVFSSWGGGSVLHATDGQQTGMDFWVHYGGVNDDSNSGCEPTMWVVSVLCPKKGMAIECTAEGGYFATYTTSGPDQCVAFMHFTQPATKRNIRVQVLGGGTPGRVIAQFQECKATEKGFTAPFLQTGTHYQIIMPPVVFAGQSFWITVLVLESGGTTKTDYDGTTSFTSTDPGALIQGTGMEGYNYTWVPATDKGVKIFFNVRFFVLGMQSIIVMDTVDGSISGVAATMVVGADIKLEKRRKLTVAASGDTVQFQLCWSNFSSATGFSFTITDAVPMGTTYVPEIASTALCAGSAPVPGVVVWYSTATSTTPPGTFTSVPGTGSPLANTRWLRWTIRDAYVNSSGCVCFKVSVN